MQHPMHTEKRKTTTQPHKETHPCIFMKVVLGGMRVDVLKKRNIGWWQPWSRMSGRRRMGWEQKYTNGEGVSTWYEIVSLFRVSDPMDSTAYPQAQSNRWIGVIIVMEVMDKNEQAISQEVHGMASKKQQQRTPWPWPRSSQGWA